MKGLQQDRWNWSDDIKSVLDNCKLSHLSKKFAAEKINDVETLLLLTREDLKDLGLGLGEAARLLWYLGIDKKREADTLVVLHAQAQADAHAHAQAQEKTEDSANVLHTVLKHQTKDVAWVGNHPTDESELEEATTVSHGGDGRMAGRLSVGSSFRDVQFVRGKSVSADEFPHLVGDDDDSFAGGSRNIHSVLTRKSSMGGGERSHFPTLTAVPTSRYQFTWAGLERTPPAEKQASEQGDTGGESDPGAAARVPARKLTRGPQQTHMSDRPTQPNFRASVRRKASPGVPYRRSSTPTSEKTSLDISQQPILLPEKIEISANIPSLSPPEPGVPLSSPTTETNPPPMTAVESERGKTSHPDTPGNDFEFNALCSPIEEGEFAPPVPPPTYRSRLLRIESDGGHTTDHASADPGSEDVFLPGRQRDSSDIELLLQAPPQEEPEISTPAAGQNLHFVCHVDTSEAPPCPSSPEQTEEASHPQKVPPASGMLPVLSSAQSVTSDLDDWSAAEDEDTDDARLTGAEDAIQKEKKKGKGKFQKHIKNITKKSQKAQAALGEMIPRSPVMRLDRESKKTKMETGPSRLTVEGAHREAPPRTISLEAAVCAARPRLEMITDGQPMPQKYAGVVVVGFGRHHRRVCVYPTTTANQVVGFMLEQLHITLDPTHFCLFKVFNGDGYDTSSMKKAGGLWQFSMAYSRPQDGFKVNPCIDTLCHLLELTPEDVKYETGPGESGPVEVAFRIENQPEEHLSACITKLQRLVQNGHQLLAQLGCVALCVNEVTHFAQMPLDDTRNVLNLIRTWGSGVNIRLGRRPLENKISIWVGTWNMGDAPPPNEFREWLPKSEYDLYAIGVQECTYEPRFGYSNFNEDWEKTILAHFAGHVEVVKVKSIRLWGMALIILARQIHVNSELIHNVQAEKIATGIGNVAGNKGCCAVSVTFANTRLCFVNSHLAAHQNKVQERNDMYYELIKRLSKTPLGVQSANLSLFDITNRFHYIFWMGDLNYRINRSREEVIDLCFKGDLEALKERDQLRDEMACNRAFSIFREGDLSFAPTYKFDRGTRDTYSEDRARVPSWCDRILYRALANCNISKVTYNCTWNVTTSDHSPVYATFTVDYRQFIDHKQKEPKDKKEKRSGKLAPPPKLGTQPTLYVLITNLQLSDIPGISNPSIKFYRPYEGKASKKLARKETKKRENVWRWDGSKVDEETVVIEVLIAGAVTKDDLAKEYMRIIVWDSKFKGNKTMVGQGTVSLANAVYGKPGPFVVELTNDGKRVGIVTGCARVATPQDRLGHKALMHSNVRTLTLHDPPLLSSSCSRDLLDLSTPLSAPSSLGSIASHNAPLFTCSTPNFQSAEFSHPATRTTSNLSKNPSIESKSPVFMENSYGWTDGVGEK